MHRRDTCRDKMGRHLRPALPRRSKKFLTRAGCMLPCCRSAGVAQLVEHHVANVNVVGPSPITRSIFLHDSGRGGGRCKIDI